MAIIGTFKKDGEGYGGNIETLTIRAAITFEPALKKSDNAPDFRIFNHADDYTSEIGAAWTKTSREGAQYLSVRLDDPSFVAPVNCRLIKSGSESGHSLVWERTRSHD